MASVTGTTNYEYNEITHSNHGDINGLDPMYHWDTHFPSRISQLTLNQEFSSPGPATRRKGRGRNRNAARYKTQPITFDEIKEVDEDTPAGKNSGQSKEEKDCNSGLKSQFTAFSRSMDGLLPSLKSSPALMRDGALTVRPKERLQTTQPDDPLTRINPELASKPNTDTDLKTKSGTSKGSEAGGNVANSSNDRGIPAGLPSTDPNRHRRRQRKRGEPKRNKSIEEAPEIDAIPVPSEISSTTNKG